VRMSLTPEEDDELKRLHLNDLRSREKFRNVVAGCAGLTVGAILAAIVVYEAMRFVNG
jgi:hypothetical protein